MPLQKPQISTKLENDLDGFKEWLYKRGLADSSSKTYISHVRKALAEGLEDRLADKSLAPFTRNSIAVALLAWADYNGNEKLRKYIEEDITLPYPIRREDEEPLAPEELDQFLNTLEDSTLPTPIIAVLNIIAIRGFRVGDILRLTKNQLRRALQTGKCTFTLKGGVKQTWKIERFHEWFESLNTYGEKFGPWETVADLIVRTKRDDYASARAACARGVKRVFKDADLDMERAHLHLLRATHALHYYTYVCDRDITKLKEYMGWMSIATAALYVGRFNVEALEDEAKILDEMRKQRKKS